MLRTLTSFRHVPALFSVALLLAMLAPVSASATGNWGGSDSGQYSNHTNNDFEILLKSKLGNDFDSDSLKPIFSIFREYLERSRDRFDDHVSNDDNRNWWGMHHGSGNFKKRLYGWGHGHHDSVTPVVPEPSTALLVFFGLAGLAVSNHRMRS